MNRCETCRYWSQMVAQSIGCGPIEALCLASGGPRKGRMMTGRETCASWASDHFGKVDDPPNYGEAVRARYEEEERQATQ